ncbi:MAG: hypothetical protein E6I08_00885 [Chloroflexi bacterium]|nr:MAG: hypothetical protein E6I08_00885 [Chloroflexota bacterium]
MEETVHGLQLALAETGVGAAGGLVEVAQGGRAQGGLGGIERGVLVEALPKSTCRRRQRQQAPAIQTGHQEMTHARA